MSPVCLVTRSFKGDHVLAAKTSLFLAGWLVVFGGVTGFVVVHPVVAEVTASGLKPDDAMAVLERFRGSWQTKTQIQHVGPPSREFNTLGKAVCQATLAGKFFEFRSESVPPGESDLQVMTYDKAAKLFRQWVYSSDGYTHTADGTWNAKTSTLRWTGKSADATFVIDDHWVSADRLEWSLRRTNARGEVIQTISGTVLRDKDAANSK